MTTVGGHAFGSERHFTREIEDSAGSRDQILDFLVVLGIFWASFEEDFVAQELKWCYFGRLL